MGDHTVGQERLPNKICILISNMVRSEALLVRRESRHVWKAKLHQAYSQFCSETFN